MTVSAIHNWPQDESASKNFFKIEIPAAVRVEGLRYLGAHNISRATLFPGIDGFAQSLAHIVMTEPRAHWLNRRVHQAVLYGNVLQKTKQQADEA